MCVVHRAVVRLVLFGVRGGVTDVGQICEDIGGCGGRLSVKLLLSR